MLVGIVTISRFLFLNIQTRQELRKREEKKRNFLSASMCIQSLQVNEDERMTIVTIL
jgi:hypothetical protein